MNAFLQGVLNKKMIVGTMLAMLCVNAYALTISGPLDADAWQSLNSSVPVTDPTSPTYGPPPSACFFEPGPLTYNSGDTSVLYAGPNKARNSAESLLFVFSASQGSLAALGQVNFVLNVDGVSVAQSFASGDFLSTGDCDLPSLPGMGNGAGPLGITFSDAYHAAARVWFDLGSVTGAEIGNVTVTSPIDVRVDVFGIGEFAVATPSVPFSTGIGGHRLPLAPTPPVTTYIYRIINNTPNSGSVGYHRVPDGGMTALLLGCALMALLVFTRGRAKS